MTFFTVLSAMWTCLTWCQIWKKRRLKMKNPKKRKRTGLWKKDEWQKRARKGQKRGKVRKRGWKWRIWNRRKEKRKRYFSDLCIVQLHNNSRFSDRTRMQHYAKKTEKNPSKYTFLKHKKIILFCTVFHSKPVRNRAFLCVCVKVNRERLELDV